MVDRFLKGPAFGEVEAPPLVEKEDVKGTQAMTVALSPEIKQIWQVGVERTSAVLTNPAIAENTVYVAASNRHQVHALDLKTGKPRWSYTAGGRPTWPATIYPGLCIFGSHDGWIYCLRASDGALAWRFRAAPRERSIVSSGQVESAWPAGPILLRKGVAYFAAGRASEVEGGIPVYGADPRTGEILWSGNARGSSRYNWRGSGGSSLANRVALSTWIGVHQKGIKLGRQWFNLGRLARKAPQGRRIKRGSWTEAHIKNGTLFLRKRDRKPTLVLASEVKLEKSSAALRLDNTLVLAGPTDGGKGMLLTFADLKKPRLLARYPLDAAPAERGLAAADGKLYISMTNGKLLCVGGK
jgi:outer membrane protein assembly factor BamB